MSIKQTDLNPSIQKLLDDGFHVEIKNQHLLVLGIPYLDANKEIVHGVLACSYAGLGDQDSRPQDHTMWLSGVFPYCSDGAPMSYVVNHSNGKELFMGFRVDHYLSNKANLQPFLNFYDKVVHYHNLLVGHARMVDPNADGRIHGARFNRDESSVFVYPDTASSRVGITALSQKFDGLKVAIIGLGGTGSYILDIVSKTPVKEIHLYDGDELEPHNAYRAPGAAKLDALMDKPKKVDYFHKQYSEMHKGIIPHPAFIEQSNLMGLEGIDFVFLSIDRGSSRRLIVNYLLGKSIPFIDVGMGLDLVVSPEGSEKISGSCRTTLVTAERQSHVSSYLNFEDDDPDQAIYSSNVQVADMNALNAILAVIKWKQYFGFYSDSCDNPHNLVYTLDFQSISRSEECEAESDGA